MVLVRPVRRSSAEDRAAVYAICLRTGDEGQDAGDALPEGSAHLMGDVWAGPYLAVEPESAAVAEDEGVVVGYVLGTRDTRRFEAACERSWWPRLRAANPLPVGPAGSWDLAARLRWLVHHPLHPPDEVVAGFPAHLHLNVQPGAQGRGIGPALLAAALERLRTDGAPGVHVGVSPANVRANRFWERGGFREVRVDPGVRWLGRSL